MSKRKTGKLTKIEKFYIDNNSDMTVEDIAKDLNRTENAIKKHIGESADTGHVDTTREEGSTVGDLMGHKEGRGVTIMTQAASEMADETRPVRVQNAKRYSDAIHIIKDK